MSHRYEYPEPKAKSRISVEATTIALQALENRAVIRTPSTGEASPLRVSSHVGGGGHIAKVEEIPVDQQQHVANAQVAKVERVEVFYPEATHPTEEDEVGQGVGPGFSVTSPYREGDYGLADRHVLFDRAASKKRSQQRNPALQPAPPPAVSLLRYKSSGKSSPSKLKHTPATVHHKEEAPTVVEVFNRLHADPNPPLVSSSDDAPGAAVVIHAGRPHHSTPAETRTRGGEPKPSLEQEEKALAMGSPIRLLNPRKLHGSNPRGTVEEQADTTTDLVSWEDEREFLFGGRGSGGGKTLFPEDQHEHLDWRNRDDHSGLPFATMDTEEDDILAQWRAAQCDEE